MKIMLLGKNGQVGWELQRTLLPVGEIVALDIDDLDLTKGDTIRETIRWIKPNIIINAAAYTNVDQAEEETELATLVNAVAPGILAEEAKRLGGSIIHYSTDYIFDGSKKDAYTEEDIPNPINAYGKTKLEGERAIVAVGLPYIIFRTCWVYGTRGKNFLLTMQRLANERNEISIVNDQYGSPTWCRYIAEVTAQVVKSGEISENSGVYNLASKGITNWHEFAKEIFTLTNKEVKLKPITTSEFPTPAKRPPNSYLSSDKLAGIYGINAPEWKHCLKLSLAHYNALPGCSKAARPEHI